MSSHEVDEVSNFLNQEIYLGFTTVTMKIMLLIIFIAVALVYYWKYYEKAPVSRGYYYY